MTSEEHAALLRQQDIDRTGEDWALSEREIEEMAENYWYEEESRMADNWSLWECRLCEEAPDSQAEFLLHLEKEHGLVLETTRIRSRLHAAKDHPDYFENTFGFYEGERLLGICVRHRERAADDPMRL